MKGRKKEKESETERDRDRERETETERKKRGGGGDSPLLPCLSHLTLYIGIKVISGIQPPMALRWGLILQPYPW